MDTTTAPPPPTDEPSTPPPFARQHQPLLRSTRDRRLGGVAGGVAEHFDVGSTLVRVAFVVVAVASVGLALIAYAAAWLLVPDDVDDEPLGHQWYREHGARAAGIAALAICALVGLAILRFLFGEAWGWHGPDHGFLVVVGLVGLAIAARTDPRRGRGDRRSRHRGDHADHADAGSAGAAGDPTAVDAAKTRRVAVPPTPEELRQRAIHRRVRATAILSALAVGVSTTVLWATGAWSIGGWIVPASMLVCLVAGLAAAPWAGWSWTVTLATLVVLVGLAVSLVPGMSLRGGIGNRYAQPTTVAQAEATTFRIGAGRQVLDLTALSTEGRHTAQIHAGMGAGSLEIRVPDDLTVVLRGHLSGGDLRIDDQPADLQGTDLDLDRIIVAPVGGADARRVVVHVDGGFGDVHLERR